jgi:hypothetical protein
MFLTCAASVILATGCGTEGIGEAVEPIVSVTASAPPPAKIPTPSAASGDAQPIAALNSNFDVNLGVKAAWGGGAMPASNAPDIVGAFRFICRPGQLGYVDPIVNPGPRGTRSHHLHQFFGNTVVESDSTYASLRAEGGSTCNEIGDPFAKGAIALNRSAYWMPAMLDGRGNVVRPDFISIYYKRRPTSDPVVSDPSHPKYQGRATDLPHGLKFIFGRDMSDLSRPATGNFYFACDGPSGVYENNGAKHFQTFSEAAAACSTTPVNGVYNRIGIVGMAPDCWDGKNLDSPNHRNHMAYADYGSQGYLKCPTTHPNLIPQFQMATWYTVDANLGTWRLTSDEMSGQPAGSTYHADFFMAWDPSVHRMFHDNCIDKLLSCSGGDLGNGKQLIGASEVVPPKPRLTSVI